MWTAGRRDLCNQLLEKVMGMEQQLWEQGEEQEFSWSPRSARPGRTLCQTAMAPGQARGSLTSLFIVMKRRRKRGCSTAAAAAAEEGPALVPDMTEERTGERREGTGVAAEREAETEAGSGLPETAAESPAVETGPIVLTTTPAPEARGRGTAIARGRGTGPERGTGRGRGAAAESTETTRGEAVREGERMEGHRHRSVTGSQPSPPPIPLAPIPLALPHLITAAQALTLPFPGAAGAATAGSTGNDPTTTMQARGVLHQQNQQQQ